MTRELYQFELSHYCERARWALDYKGLTYTKRNLVPAFHSWQIRKLHSKARTVPLLLDNGNIICDSGEIIDFLEINHPTPALNPTTEAGRATAKKIEDFACDTFGIHLRRFFYYWAFATESDDVVKRLLLLNADNENHKKWFLRGYGFIRALMTKKMKLTEENAQKSEYEIINAMDKLSQHLSQRNYCVEETFTRADLTVASLLSPLCLPKEHPIAWPEESDWPEPLNRLRDRHFRDPVFQWVLKMYRQHRSPSMATDKNISLDSND